MSLITEALQSKIATDFLRETEGVKGRFQGVHTSIQNTKTNLELLKTTLVEQGLDADGSRTAEIDEWVVWLSNTKTMMDGLDAMPS